MDLEIREFKETDSISELTQLIHTAYKPLADMGFQMWGSWQTDEITKDRVDRAHTTLVAHNGERMIATISLYSPRPNHPCEHYREAWCFGQFAVLPEVQRSGIGTQLIDLVEQRAKEEGAQYLALDTAETADHLIRYYEKRGYSFVQYIQVDKVNYRSVVMSKML